MPGPPVIYAPGPPVIIESGPPPPLSGRQGRAPRESDNPYTPRLALPAVVTPRLPRIPLPRPAPAPRPVQTGPREVEGELLERQVVIWEDYGDLPPGTYRRMGRDIEGEVVRSGRSSERGPFGTRRQGEIVIVGRRPPRPPITIGGVPVEMKRRGSTRVITSPPRLPLPRAPMPQPPPRVEIPRPPMPTIPTPLPPAPLPVPAPAPLPAPLPAPVPSIPAPQPPSTPRSQSTTPGRTLGRELARIVLGALSRQRSSWTLPKSWPTSLGTSPALGAIATATPMPVPVPTPAAALPSASVAPLTALSTATASFSPPRIPTRTRTRECHCDDRPKKRAKRRPCAARGQLTWASGPKKGKPAGSRCIRFGVTK